MFDLSDPENDNTDEEYNQILIAMRRQVLFCIFSHQLIVLFLMNFLKLNFSMGPGVIVRQPRIPQMASNKVME